MPLSSFIHPSYLNEDLNYYKDLEIYSSHGTFDEVIPISLVENYIESLAKNNNLVFDRFDAGHTISEMNLTKLVKWIDMTNI